MPTTERLFLRDVQPTDKARVLSIMSMPEVYKYYGIKILTLEDAIIQMEWYASHQQKNTGVYTAICEIGSQELIGVLGIHKNKENQPTAEIGFWLSPSFWGKSIMVEAAKVAIPEAFERLNLHRLEAEVEIENPQSSRVLKKLGFQLESIKKECEYKEGKYIDLEAYTLFKNQLK